MHKFARLLMLIAAGLIANPVAAVARILRVAALPRSPTAAIPGFNHGVFAVGGMTGDGMMGDGMASGGMMGGGMAGGGMMGGGMTGGGMVGGGTFGGGMTGGMTGGGMTGGMESGATVSGTGGMVGGGTTGMPNGPPGYGDLPIYGGVTGDTVGSQSYGTNKTNATDARSRKIYHCVTRGGRCAVDSSFGAPRKGDSCGCLLGGPGKVQ